MNAHLCKCIFSWAHGRTHFADLVCMRSETRIRVPGIVSGTIVEKIGTSVPVRAISWWATAIHPSALYSLSHPPPAPIKSLKSSRGIVGSIIALLDLHVSMQPTSQTDRQPPFIAVANARRIRISTVPSISLSSGEAGNIERVRFRGSSLPVLIFEVENMYTYSSIFPQILYLTMRSYTSTKILLFIYVLFAFFPQGN